MEKNLITMFFSRNGESVEISLELSETMFGIGPIDHAMDKVFNSYYDVDFYDELSLSMGDDYVSASIGFTHAADDPEDVLIYGTLEIQLDPKTFEYESCDFYTD